MKTGLGAWTRGIKKITGKVMLRKHTARGAWMHVLATLPAYGSALSIQNFQRVRKMHMGKTLFIQSFRLVFCALLLAAAVPTHAAWWTGRVSDET